MVVETSRITEMKELRVVKTVAARRLLGLVVKAVLELKLGYWNGGLKKAGRGEWFAIQDDRLYG